PAPALVVDLPWTAVLDISEDDVEGDTRRRGITIRVRHSPSTVTVNFAARNSDHPMMPLDSPRIAALLKLIEQARGQGSRLAD
ncbi:hypothetical protein QN363_20285, partial [Undibacterium sp. CCC2.1]